MITGEFFINVPVLLVLAVKLTGFRTAYGTHFWVCFSKDEYLREGGGSVHNSKSDSGTKNRKKSPCYMPAFSY